MRWRASLDRPQRWRLDFTLVALCLLIIWLELADIFSFIGFR
jgi:hypothetical protein